MTVYVTADLHLGHANIIGHTGRPFDNVEDMNEAIIDGWRRTVTDRDTVWILGDFALSNDADQLRGWYDALPGHKRLDVGVDGLAGITDRSYFEPWPMDDVDAMLALLPDYEPVDHHGRRP